MSLFVFVLYYGDILYDNCSEPNKLKLETVLLVAARFVVGAKRRTSHDLKYQETGWTPLGRHRKIHKLDKLYAIVKGRTPRYVFNQLPANLNVSCRVTRGSVMRDLATFVLDARLFRKSLFHLGLIYKIAY